MITLKDNGVVKFLEEGETPFDEIQSTECNCKGREFCQIVHSGDSTPFQVGLSEATGADLASNGTFTTDISWTKGSGWTIAGGKAVHTASGGGALSQTIGGLRAATYYKLVFTVAGYSNSQTMSISLTGDTIKTLNANGTYTVYWFTDATLTNQVLSFTPHSTTSLNIDNLTVYEISTVVYGIKDMNNSVIKTVTDGTGVTYYQDSASIEVNWSDVDDGCYRLFLIDNSNNLFTDGDDGTFEADVNGLTAGTGISLSQSIDPVYEGSVSCQVDSGLVDPVTDLLFSGDTAMTLEANKDYIISGWVNFFGTSIATSVAGNREAVYLKPTSYSVAQCDIVNMAFGISGPSGGFFGTYRYIDGSYSSTTLSLPSTWKYISTYFNSGNNTSINIGLYLNGTLVNYFALFGFWIDQVQVRGPVEIQSECFKKGSFDCTKVLSWSNNEDAYGYTYDGNTFQHELRVKSKLWKAKYPKDKKEVFVDSAGNRRILTSRTKKEELLSLEEIPTYLHDAFSIGLEHDNFYIDGVKYINEETDYDPAWRNSSLLAPVEVTVTKDSQDLSNSYC